MLVGTLLTDLGIFLNWGFVLLNLCPIWLGLSALGYLGTGWGSRNITKQALDGGYAAVIQYCISKESDVRDTGSAYEDEKRLWSFYRILHLILIKERRNPLSERSEVKDVRGRTSRLSPRD